MKSLIDSKLEKFKNLWEESDFYWGEIAAGTLKFDRVESEVKRSPLLKMLQHCDKMLYELRSFLKFLSVFLFRENRK